MSFCEVLNHFLAAQPHKIFTKPKNLCVLLKETEIEGTIITEDMVVDVEVEVAADVVDLVDRNHCLQNHHSQLI